eukprot:320379_1
MSSISPPPLYRIPTIFHGIRTNLILNGYIRMVAIPLLLINELDEDIETLILLYIGEYFKYYGKYSHIINDKNLIPKILHINTKDKLSYQMPNFASYDWELNIYPNGITKINNSSFDIFLKLLTFTDHKLITRWSICCLELNSSHTHIDTFKQRDELGWPYGTLLTSELENNINKLNTLTFIIEIQILKIYKEEDIIYDVEDEKK